MDKIIQYLETLPLDTFVSAYTIFFIMEGIIAIVVAVFLLYHIFKVFKSVGSNLNKRIRR